MKLTLTPVEHEVAMTQHFGMIDDIAKAPTPEIATARDSYRALLISPETLQQRAEALVSGEYGYAAAFEAAKHRLPRTTQRGSRPVALATLLAAYECGCPAAEASQVWGELSRKQQGLAASALTRALETDSTDVDEG